MGESMIKFALIGGQDIKKYTIADVVWNEIRIQSGVDFDFEIIPISMSQELYRFYWEFLENKNYIGFNVALPWKGEVPNLVDTNEFVSNDCFFVNTVYKTNNRTYSKNTDVLGIEKALIGRAEIFGKKILVLGAGGAGCATSVYLSRKYEANIFIFDISPKNTNYADIKTLSSYCEILQNKYDIIINASTVGKFNLYGQPSAFSTPLSKDMFENIAHEGTVLQEMNYLPYMTEFLRMGLVENLKVISGVEMLVYQAVYSFQTYTNHILNEDIVQNILHKIKIYSLDLEKEIYGRSFNNT